MAMARCSCALRADTRMALGAGRRLLQLITAGPTLSAHYAYSANGQLLAQTYPSGKSVYWTYDAGGRVQWAVINNQIAFWDYAYDPLGRPTSISRSNGTVLLRQYDQDGRVSAHEYFGDMRPVSYDAASRGNDTSVLGSLCCGSESSMKTTAPWRRRDIEPGTDQCLKAMRRPN